jgi:hypothetical protein
MSLENSTCDRCNTKKSSLRGSYFNTEMLCTVCENKEQSHPKYNEAKNAELSEVLKGNYNYKGIGLPSSLA